VSLEEGSDRSQVPHTLALAAAVVLRG